MKRSDRGDQGRPESEKDLEHIREKNNQQRRANPELPGSLGDSHLGVLSNRKPKDDKAGSGTKGSHPKR